MKEALTEYLRTHRKLFSLAGLEREIGCPKQTLHHAINNTQPLPDKWSLPLRETLYKLLMHDVLIAKAFQPNIIFHEGNVSLEKLKSFWNEQMSRGVIVLPTTGTDEELVDKIVQLVNEETA
jgi:hypothetical protein